MLTSAIYEIDANLGLIESGLAWHFKKYAHEQSTADRRAYAKAEKRARAKKIGIWSHGNPMPPWDFRYGVSHDPSIKGKIVGNRRSGIYHWEGCSGFTKTSVRNRQIFKTPEHSYRSTK